MPADYSNLLWLDSGNETDLKFRRETLARGIGALYAVRSIAGNSVTCKDETLPSPRRNEFLF